jgi:hypothetical protein
LARANVEQPMFAGAVVPERGALSRRGIHRLDRWNTFRDPLRCFGGRRP